MMKKIFLMTGLMCITLTIQAQKVKVKDGVVMLDGVPILGIVGRIGLSKMDIVYTSLQGDSLLSIKRKRHIVSSGFGATFDIRYGWCEMYFFNPKIHVKYKELTTYTT